MSVTGSEPRLAARLTSAPVQAGEGAGDFVAFGRRRRGEPWGDGSPLSVIGREGGVILRYAAGAVSIAADERKPLLRLLEFPLYPEPSVNEASSSRSRIAVMFPSRRPKRPACSSNAQAY